MVLRVDIGVVFEVEDNVWADASTNTIAKGADLHGGQQNEEGRISVQKTPTWTGKILSAIVPPYFKTDF